MGNLLSQWFLTAVQFLYNFFPYDKKRIYGYPFDGFYPVFLQF